MNVWSVKVTCTQQRALSTSAGCCALLHNGQEFPKENNGWKSRVDEMVEPRYLGHK